MKHEIQPAILMPFDDQAPILFCVNGLIGKSNAVFSDSLIEIATPVISKLFNIKSADAQHVVEEAILLGLSLVTNHSNGSVDELVESANTQMQQEIYDSEICHFRRFQI